MTIPVDLEVEKADRAESCLEVTPEVLLKLALRDCQQYGDVKMCYVTLLREGADGCITTSNYRANMKRDTEIAYRQIGVQEVIERWMGR